MFISQQGGQAVPASCSLGNRIASIDDAVERWKNTGKRYPSYRSEQEIGMVLDRIGVNWEYVDGMDKHMIVFRRRSNDSAVSYAFCPDIYLPDHDVYIEITTSGLIWPTKQVKTTKTDCLSIKRYKTALARSMYGRRVVLVYGSRYQRLTSRNIETSFVCLHDLIRKYGHPGDQGLKMFEIAGARG